MDRIVYRLTLDAHKGGIQKTLQGFLTGESLARRIVVNIVSNGKPLVLTENHVASMYVTKPNMTDPCINECTIEENQIIYDVLQTDIDAEGIVKMQLKVIDDGKVLLSPIFALEVNESEADDTEATQTPTYTALEAALLEAKAVYNARIVSVELTDDHIFRINYADGTSYESDTLTALLGIEESEEARITAEAERVLAEEKREKDFNVAITEANNATASANGIVDDVHELLKGGGVVTPSQIEAWDESLHQHDNKAILDATTASFTTEDKAKLDTVTEYVHPTSGVTEGTYRNVTVNAEGHVTDGNNEATPIAYGGTGATTAEEARANLGASKEGHTHSASGVTAGTFGGDVSAPASTNYSGALVRNAVILEEDPGEGATVTYPSATLIFVR